MDNLSSVTKRSRLVFLDVIRAYACIMMIFGHTFDSLIHENLRQTALFQQWQQLRGLTAPTFLFVSGFAFYVATTRYWSEYLHWSPRLAKRLRRVGFLLVIGYLLHFPYFNPLDLLHGSLTHQQWRSWMNVDILQCVALNLLILHVLILAIKSRTVFLRTIAVAMPLVFLLSPLIWGLNGTADTPALWNYYLGGNFGSFFPLVPWIGFMYAGILGGHWYATYLKDRSNWTLYFLLGGISLLVPAFMVNTVYQWLPPAFQFPTLSAPTLWFRLAAVVIIFSLIAFLVRKVQSIPSIITTIGAETLNLYWMHLVIVYGSAWNLGLDNPFGQGLYPLQAFMLFTILLTSLTMVILLKNSLRRQIVPRWASGLGGLRSRF